jgi:nucleotide-binding universal stress UspA family protein
MLLIKAILHPTDFSANSRIAFELACSLARDYGARLILLNVQPAFVNDDPANLVRLPLTEDRDERLAKLTELQTEAAPITADSVLRLGDSADETVRVAEEHHCDLIVMGTHGRTGLRRFLMGSIAEAVLRQARCPVLTVKRPLASAECAPGPGPAGRIAVSVQ